jgi:hypothetical protein
MLGFYFALSGLILCFCFMHRLSSVLIYAAPLGLEN